MTDTTRLEAIDTLIALDTDFERDGIMPQQIQDGDWYLGQDKSGAFNSFRWYGATSEGLHWKLRRKRPVTVTLEGVPVEWAEWLRDINYKNEGGDWKVAKEAARRALEALEKGND